MKKIGIDLGATNIAAGLVDEDRKIIFEHSVKTITERSKGSYENAVNNTFTAVKELLEKSGTSREEIQCVGIGSPGICDIKAGTVVFSGNLRWNDRPIAKDVQDLVEVKTVLMNDANAAAYGEYVAGAAKGKNSAVVLTVGTGIGSGVIIKGNLFNGEGFGGELGHTVISTEKDAKKCSCGRSGCFEAYASGTALVRYTREAIDAEPECRMAEFMKLHGKINPRTAFESEKLGDTAAIEVVEKYLFYLSTGLKNIILTFNPEIICLGGGVGNEGENLTNRIKNLIYGEKDIFDRAQNITQIVPCALGNNAGIIGAAEWATTRT